MTRTPPPEDWVVYIVVLSVVAAIMFGKYLMGRGDKDEFISSNKTPLKKEDIQAQYEEELSLLLEKYKSNPPKQLEEKKLFLQKCNSELSRNIFFTETEAINLLRKLSKV